MPDKAGIAVTFPKPMTSGVEARGRFGKRDFVYLGDEDAYRCPAGEKLTYHYTNEENGQELQRYWTNACRDCSLKAGSITGKERRITRWKLSTLGKSYSGASITIRRPCGSGGR